ncbi:MAG TPA: hypothetical protein VMQ38_02125 [Mycobacterium sp.]|nr:hypothetical protein [Mycobacterium sp.]
MTFHRSAASGDIPADDDEHAVAVGPRQHEAPGTLVAVPANGEKASWVT